MIEMTMQLERLYSVIRERPPEEQAELMEFWKEGVLHGVELSKQSIRFGNFQSTDVNKILDELKKIIQESWDKTMS